MTERIFHAYDMDYPTSLCGAQINDGSFHYRTIRVVGREFTHFDMLCRDCLLLGALMP